MFHDTEIKQKDYDLKQELSGVYKEVFLSLKGKLILADLMKAGKTFTRAVTSNPEVNMYERGTQDFVTRILEIIELDIDELLK